MSGRAVQKSERTTEKPERTTEKPKRKAKKEKALDRICDENGNRITWGEAVKRGIISATGREYRPDPTGLKAANVPTSGRPTAKGVQSVVRGGHPGQGKNR